jgi:NTE family protein
VSLSKIRRTSVIDYIDANLTHEHVLASAAILLAFPPVHVSTSAEVAGYYCDGGVRLNTPIKLALGCGRSGSSW